MPPTVVIIPAAFTPPEIYYRFASVLQENDLESVIVSLPSVGLPEDGNTPGTMLDDADEITRVVINLLDHQGKHDIVLLTHSYGGIPASESMKALSTQNRGGKPGISLIIYVASIVLPVGVSNDEMRKRPPPPWATKKGNWIISDHSQEIEYDFNDLPTKEGRLWASKLQQHSALSFADKATYAGYNDVEVHYVRCTKDAALPAEGTERILAVIRESSGREPHIHDLAAGHYPHLSKPEELTHLVKKILNA